MFVWTFNKYAFIHLCDGHLARSLVTDLADTIIDMVPYLKAFQSRVSIDLMTILSK
jgi:hypothetical protein